MKSTLKALCMLVAVGLVAAVASTPCPALEPVSDPAAEWFSLSPESGRSWLQQMGPSPDHILIHPPQPSDSDPKALVLFAKTSSAYQISMNRMLAVFQQKKMRVAWTLFNFHEDPARAAAETAKARKGEYQIVFAMGSGATDYLHRRMAGSSTPVVTVCSKDPVLMGLVDSYEGGSGTNFAYTSLNVPVEVQMNYLRTLRPNLSQIAIVYARDNVSAVRTQVKPMADKAQEAGIEIHRVVVGNRDRAQGELKWRIRRAVKAMRDHDPRVEKSVFWITGSTSVFEEMDTILQHTGNVPVLAVTPSLVTSGDHSALLSIGTSFESNAKLAALYGIRILRGSVDPGSLDVGVILPPDISINFKKAHDIGLKIPFEFFESASRIFDVRGRLVREHGQKVEPR